MDLAAHIKHCEILLRDVEHALADYQAKQDGWVLRYAVDFSEIYAYVMPKDSHESAPFSDGWISNDDPLRQFYILSKFFGERNILLPRPYALELASFTDRLAAKELATAADQYLDALKDIAKLIDAPETVAILAQAETFDSHPPPDSQIAFIIDYFDRCAPQLVAFARGADLEPFARLQNLLKARPFLDFEQELPQAAAYLDESRVRRRFQIFSVKRTTSNPAANLIDAQALEHIRAANEALANDRVRVLLVSRSAYMMAVVQSEYSTMAETYIRHPRTVSAAYRPSKQGLSVTDEAELLLRRESLNAFVTGARDVVERRLTSATEQSDLLDEIVVVDSSTRRTLRDLLEQIKTDWHNVEAYSAALTDVGETRAKTPEESRKAVALELLSFLRDRSRLRLRVLSQIRDIFREVRRSRDMVAFRLQSATPTDSRGSVVYPISFVANDELHARVVECSTSWWSSLAEAETLFELSISSVDDYDCLLGIAVSLAAIGRWNLARRYADYALITRSEGHRREGLLFRAVCYNRASRIGEPVSRAMSRMRSAIESLEEGIGETTQVDPRFLNELAAVKLWLIEFARTAGIDVESQEIPRPEEVCVDLNVALSVAATSKLQIQILNSLCYANLLAKNYGATALILNDLQTALTRAYPQRSQWPAFALDTVNYANFLVHEHTLSETVRPEMIEAWAQELAKVVDQPHVFDQEIRLINSHVVEMQEAATRLRTV